MQSHSKVGLVLQHMNFGAQGERGDTIQPIKVC